MPRILLLVLACSVLFVPVYAGETDVDQLKSQLVRSIPELAAAKLKPSAIPSMYEVEMDSQIFYISADGKHLLMGDMLELATRANLTEAKREAMRVRLLGEAGEKNMIVMGPKNPKHTITVFTDVDCPYCVHLHNDVPALNQAGVKVRYLLYPRAGIKSETYKRSVAVWCAADRVKAVGIAKAGGKLEMKTCANPVSEHFALGQRLGVTGTPTIFLDNGKLISGYLPAQRLLAMLNNGASSVP